MDASLANSDDVADVLIAHGIRTDPLHKTLRGVKNSGSSAKFFAHVLILLVGRLLGQQEYCMISRCFSSICVMRVLVLTGAGVSAESGIPTFRGRTVTGGILIRQSLRRLKRSPASIRN